MVQITQPIINSNQTLCSAAVVGENSMCADIRNSWPERDIGGLREFWLLQWIFDSKSANSCTSACIIIVINRMNIYWIAHFFDPWHLTCDTWQSLERKKNCYITYSYIILSVLLSIKYSISHFNLCSCINLRWDLTLKPASFKFVEFFPGIKGAK